jgi:hypothetical protein
MPAAQYGHADGVESDEVRKLPLKVRISTGG